MIITVGNIKGGVGKTTLAVNIAIHQANQGKSTLLVDTDEQKTASFFSQIREKNPKSKGSYTCVNLFGAAVRNQGRKLSKNFDDTVIDCAGKDSAALRAAITICDILILPLGPRSFEFWTMTQLMDIISEIESLQDLPKIFAVINMADSVGSDNESLITALNNYEKIITIKHLLVRRKVWPESSSQGLSVEEFSPKCKGASEFKKFMGFLKDDYHKN